MIKPLVALLFVGVANAQSAKEVTLTFPEGYIAQTGVAVVYSASFVDAVVRMQDPAYLQTVIDNSKPKPPPMKVGVVIGKAFDQGCPDIVYLSGWVVEKAARVDLTVDGAPPVSVVPVATMAGYPKTWKWCLPAKWQDGKPHKLYTRAVSGSNMLIGPLDNATALNRWTFQVPQ
jgi:hypothetical protein